MNQIQCPSCSHCFNVPDHYLERLVKCRDCSHEFKAQRLARPTAPPADKLLPPVLNLRFGPATFALGASVILAIGAVPVSAWMLKSASEQKVKEQRAAQDFERRREEANDAYNHSRINVAEREGLLARIRDEEEKLKRGD